MAFNRNPFHPSETDVLVLRYLNGRKCKATAESFVRESDYLKSACNSPDSFNAPSVFGGLTDILNEYGKAKLSVKDLIIKLTEWNTTLEDLPSPHDTLTTQIRFITRILIIYVLQPSSNQPALRELKPLSIPKFTQTSPDTSVIRTKKVASTCTSEDRVLHDVCPNGCSLRATAPVRSRKMVATETQTASVPTQPMVSTVESETQTTTVPTQPPVSVVERDTQTEFISPIVKTEHTVLVEPPNQDGNYDNGIENISEDESPETDTGNEAIDKGTESEPEGDLKVVAAEMFYNTILFDENYQNKLANLANRQLSTKLNFNQLLAESPVKQELVTPVDDPAVATEVQYEVDQFLEELLREDPDPGTEMEEGEIVEDSQDNIGEFKAAERNLMSILSNKQNSNPNTPNPHTSSTPIPIAESSPSARLNTSSFKPLTPIIAQPSQACAHSVSLHAGISIHSVPPINTEFRTARKSTQESQFQAMPQVPNQVDSASKNSLRAIKKESPENVIATKSSVTNENVSKPRLQIQKPAVRNKSAWQNIGRRSIVPKIPPGHSTAPIEIDLAPESPPVLHVPEHGTSESSTTEKESENASQANVTARLHKPSIPENISALDQHTQHALKEPEVNLPNLPTPQSNVLASYSRYRQVQSTPTKKQGHVRSLKFSTPKGAKQVQDDYLNESKQRLGSSGLYKKPIAQKALFANRPMHQESHAEKKPEPKNSRKSNEIEVKENAKLRGQSARTDRKRVHSPEKKETLNDKRSLQKSAPRVSNPLRPPVKKMKTDDPAKQALASSSPSVENDAAKIPDEQQAPQNNTVLPESTTNHVEPPRDTGSEPGLPNLPTDIPERTRQYDSRRKAKEPAKRPAGDISLTQSTSQPKAPVPPPAPVASVNNAPSLPLTYNDLNFSVPRTPRCKGVLDSDWESQSSESFESLLRRVQPVALLTPLKDNELPETPGKTLNLQTGLNDSVSPRRKSSFADMLSTALRRVAPAANAYSSVSVSLPRKSDCLPTNAFPEGHGPLVKQASVPEARNISRVSSAPTAGSAFGRKSQPVNPVIVKQEPRERIPAPHKKQAPVQAKVKSTPPESANSNQSTGGSVQFSVSGKQKKLTCPERSTSVSLCELSQVGSPNSRLLTTPRQSPLHEIEDNLRSPIFGKEVIEAMLRQVHKKDSRPKKEP